MAEFITREAIADLHIDQNLHIETLRVKVRACLVDVNR